MAMSKPKEIVAYKEFAAAPSVQSIRYIVIKLIIQIILLIFTQTRNQWHMRDTAAHNMG